MSRIVSKLALLQVSVIVLGFFALATVLKVNGYPNIFESTIRWNPTAVFLREHGGWLLHYQLCGSFSPPSRRAVTPVSSRTGSLSSLEPRSRS
jgi:hypothetical protein